MSSEFRDQKGSAPSLASSLILGLSGSAKRAVFAKSRGVDEHSSRVGDGRSDLLVAITKSNEHYAATDT